MISPLCILSQWREKVAGTVAWLFEGLRAERVCWSSSLGDITNLTPPLHVYWLSLPSTAAGAPGPDYVNAIILISVRS